MRKWINYWVRMPKCFAPVMILHREETGPKGTPAEEGINILRLKIPPGFCSRNNIDTVELKSILERKNIATAEQTHSPLLDDKMILGLPNALMNTATNQAYAATGMRSSATGSKNNMKFLLTNSKPERKMNFIKAGRRMQQNTRLPRWLCLSRRSIDTSPGDNSRYQLAAQGKSNHRTGAGEFQEEGTGFFLHTGRAARCNRPEKESIWRGHPAMP